MTLKEKFKKQLDTATPTLNRPFYQAKKCEKIADDYAIEFYLWMKDNEERIKNGKIITDEDLLKEFKKEKGL
jgi:hypothetical protein